MIRFIKHNAMYDYMVGRFKIPKGSPILKVEFEKNDIHTRYDGTMHIDIWGDKFKSLEGVIHGTKNRCSEPPRLHRIQVRRRICNPGNNDNFGNK